MILKGKPNQVVQRRVRKPNRKYKIVPWFKFDEDGYAEINKMTPIEKARLLKRFTEVDLKPSKKETEPIALTDNKISYKELQRLYTDKTGNTAVGMKKADIMKELGI